MFRYNEEPIKVDWTGRVKKSDFGPALVDIGVSW
jgi:hypothetical protein